MRFLGIGDSNDLGDMYLRLQEAGHEVKVFVADEQHRGKLAGLVARVPAWEAELPWLRAAGADGMALFETAHHGDVQEQLRRDGFNVIGGCGFGDRLENDRRFGQRCMRDVGMRTAPSHEFHDFDAAERFIAGNPGRYVFKPNGQHLESRECYVGEFLDGSDLQVMLKRERSKPESRRASSFVLMPHLEGVEVGVGAYFNGQCFMEAVCIDWEHKRFFAGEMGEMTGEMGTLVSYRHSQALFDATLAKMSDMLRVAGYVGYINLNTIVNEAGIWPLEFTCRFGYPGYAILDCLHEEGWEELFSRMIHRTRLDFRTRDGFGLGAVLTIPPFPFAVDRDATDGLPLKFKSPLSQDEQRNLHFDEVRLSDGNLVTSGPTGYVMVVTGHGSSVRQAQSAAYSLLRKVVVPNGRYRLDIGDRFIDADRAALQNARLWPASDRETPEAVSAR